MTEYLRAQYNLDDSDCISAADDLPFWSAPFGIKLLDKVRYKKNICALDIGFGSGFPLLEIAMRLGATCKVFGIDPSIPAAKRTRLKLKYADVKNVELVEGAAEAMPFGDNYFDLIVSNNGLNNVQDLAKVLAECSRISRISAQMVFTFNTDATFKIFYDVFREVLRERGFKECELKIDAHIHSKRRPVPQVENLLSANGFKIRSIDKDEFSYHFTDGTSMLNHFFIKLAFMECWKEIVPGDIQADVFRSIEDRLNSMAEKEMGFEMRVPFVTIDCENAKKPVQPEKFSGRKLFKKY
ncbi:MAG: methyltransferase domain-containing protein [Bacteroidetes bacterium]|nr:methyltransferase domain-containing protein [Bacteroidota bacterium]